MRRLKILGLTLMAVFVLSAVVSATASAEELLMFLPEVTQNGRGEGGLGTAEVLGGKNIICKKATSEATIEKGQLLGLFHVDVEECKGEKQLVTCTGLGEKAGVILVLGTYHIVFDKLGSGTALGVAVLGLLEPVHMTCLTTLVEVTGQLLCLITPIETLTKHFEIICKQRAAGDPEETIYWNEKGEEVKLGENALLFSFNHGTGEMSAIATSALMLTEKEVLLMG